MMLRRELMLGGAAVIGLGAIGGARWRAGAGAAAEESFEIERTEAEWRETLTDREFQVLRRDATETPYTSELLDEGRKGAFTCAGCDLDLYASETKYDSGTGWPSFYRALPDAVGTRADNSLLMTRTEVHCRRCGGHLGHIFEDGPPPTGKRHCINGVALDFRAA